MNTQMIEEILTELVMSFPKVVDAGWVRKPDTGGDLRIYELRVPKSFGEVGAIGRPTGL